MAYGCDRPSFFQAPTRARSFAQALTPRAFTQNSSFTQWLRHAVSRCAFQDDLYRRFQRHAMSDADINRTDETARSNCGAYLNIVFRIKRRYTGPVLHRKLINLTHPIERFFGYTNRRNIQDDPHVRGKAAAPWMGA